MSDPRETTPTRASITIGQRIAGGLLIAGTLPYLWLWHSFPMFLKPIGWWFVPQTAIDFVLGVLLLAGAGKWPVRLAILRASGSILFVLMTASALSALLAVGVVAPLSLLLLLWGRATIRRIAIGCAAYGVLAGLGVAVQLGWAPPFLGARSGSFIVTGDLVPHAEFLRGKALSYDLAVKDDSWRLLSPAAAARTDDLADLVAVNVRTGAILSTYVHERPATSLSVRQYARGVDSILVSKPDSVEELGPLQAHPLRSQLLRLAWNDPRLKERWKGLRAILLGVGWGLQISARVPESAFEALEPSFREVLESVRISPERLEPPEGMALLENARLAEPGWPFRIELRGAGWHQVSGKALSSLLAAAGAEAPPDSRFFRRLYTSVDLRIVSGALDDESVDAKQVVDIQLAEMRQKSFVIQGLVYKPEHGAPAKQMLATFDVTKDSALFHAALATRAENRKYVVGMLSAPAADKKLFDEALRELETLDFAR